jgi:CSLREA domain-containing protein
MVRAKPEGPLARKIWTLGLLVALVAAGLMLSAGPAHAKTFTVDSTVDPGNGTCSAAAGCTLREAIVSANDAPGRDAIAFDIPGSGVRTIALSSDLPDITGPVTIDGYTQPGSSPNTRATGALDAVVLIELSGAGSMLDINASSVVVRGLVINRSSGNGIEIDRGTGSRIEGNFIGTDPSGTLDRGNFCFGVQIDGGEKHTIGGTSPEKRNLISGNNCDGLEISDNGKGGNRVQGNLIGTQKDAISPLGNSGNGMYVDCPSNTIGGTQASAANTIASNVGVGIAVDLAGDRADTGNRILGNSIFSNSGLGIDLDEDGRTANDPGDPDAGPNTLQNFPVLSSVVVTEENTTEIEGTLDSTPSTKRKKRTFTVQFFANPSASGEEGKTFLGQKRVATNRQGKASISFVAPEPVRAGENFVTATATGPGGNTSEFSEPVPVSRN